MWRESTGDFWKPEKVDDSVTGILIEKKEEVGQNKSALYLIEESETNNVLKVWGSTVLDDRMIPVRIGQLVRITYKGLAEKGKGGKQPAKLWKVEYKDVEPEDVFKK